jgi:type II secretory pathway component GspD/PulD (secretin)
MKPHYRILFYAAFFLLAPQGRSLAQSDTAVAPAATPEVKPAAVEVATQVPAPKLEKGENDNISIALENVPVETVVRMFARQANANIVASSLPATNVTVCLQDVPWDAALRKILGSVGLALVKDEDAAGIYSVVNKSEVAVEPIKSDIIFLNFTTSSNILPVVEKLIAGTSSNATVAAFPGANAIVVRAPATQLEQIRQVVTRLDVEREQVAIECKFVELNDQAIKDLGINWQSLEGWTVGIQQPSISFNRTTTKRDSGNKTVKKADIDVDSTVNSSLDSSSSGTTTTTGGKKSSTTTTPPGTSTTTTEDSDNTTETSSLLSSFSAAGLNGKNFTDFDAEKGKITMVPTRDNRRENLNFNGTESVNALSAVLTADAFAATLSALQQNTGTEVVSNPKIVVASGQTATIHVGRNEPNVVSRREPNGTSFITTYELDGRQPFIEIGVRLKVTPVLNTSNSISLKIMPELSRKIGDRTYGGGDTTFPITETRTVTTEFNIRSGHTVALGGLTQQSDQEKVSKIPVLGDIPIIGKYLFSHTHTEKLQDEVIIFVTASGAAPSTMQQVTGIPEDAKLIHRHLARKVEEAAKAEELANKKAAPKAKLPK